MKIEELKVVEQQKLLELLREGIVRTSWSQSCTQLLSGLTVTQKADLATRWGLTKAFAAADQTFCDLVNPSVQTPLFSFGNNGNQGGPQNSPMSNVEVPVQLPPARTVPEQRNNTTAIPASSRLLNPRPAVQVSKPFRTVPVSAITPPTNARTTHQASTDTSEGQLANS